VGELMKRGQEQSIEVLNKRLDGTGVREPTIAAQGEDRILVQMPGIDDPALVSDVLTQTTFLEFKLVLASAPNEETLRAQQAAQINEEREIVFELNDNGEVIEALLVDKKPVLTGAMLEDARVGFDQGNRPTVDFVWNSEGTKLFRDFSRNNIGNRMAAVIDQSKGTERSRYVVTAPVIRAEIGKRGMIEGRFKPEEASKLALQLRSGALPIPLIVEEQRAVGPALGADSVRAGVRSVAAGGLLVLVFMAVYYQSAGVIANLSLLLNLIIILGLMSFAQATLSLPGIAGLVLTVGMAVDANVIIYERIREELRAGKSMRNAVQVGFNRSRWAIIDSNITGMIAAFALLYYGRGPVQGFAVTFTIGILGSVFCALVVSRVMIDVVLARWPQALKV
jgi:preprotein translocase subunit SecD